MSELWNRVAKVPTNYLKPIGFGNLKGKSDINPQWRVKVMTEVYGMCGKGWYHESKERWSSICDNGEVLCFCEVNVFIKNEDGWGKPIVGFGGNKLVTKNKNGLIPNDEGWKMAYTDALGTALKSVGVASEIYEGNFDGSKYADGYKPYLNDITGLIKWAKSNGANAEVAIAAAQEQYEVVFSTIEQIKEALK